MLLLASSVAYSPCFYEGFIYQSGVLGDHSGIIKSNVAFKLTMWISHKVPIGARHVVVYSVLREMYYVLDVSF